MKRNSSKKLLANKIVGLGGKIEPEENLISSAKREFAEETGLKLLDPKFKGVYLWIDKDFIGISFILVASKYKGTLLSDNDEGTLDWYDLNTINQLKDLAPYQKSFLPEIIKSKNYFYSSISIWNGEKIMSYLDTKNYFLDRLNAKMDH